MILHRTSVYSYHKNGNHLGTLGRFTEIPNSAEKKAILEAGNFDIGKEGDPEYAEGLDGVNIVKVVCGGNSTFAISDQGHLYGTGTFKVCIYVCTNIYYILLK